MNIKPFYVLFVASILVLQPVSGYSLDINFKTTSNTRVNFSLFSGKLLIVDTFATWCEPCRSEISKLYDVQQALTSNVTILSLDVSPGTDNLAKIRGFITNLETNNNQKYTWMFGLDDQGEFIKKFPIQNIPTLFLFDQNGVLKNQWQGPTDPTTILQAVNASLTNFKSINDPFRQLLNNFAFQITFVIFIMAIIYFYVIPKKHM